MPTTKVFPFWALPSASKLLTVKLDFVFIYRACTCTLSAPSFITCQNAIAPRVISCELDSGLVSCNCVHVFCLVHHTSKHETVTRALLSLVAMVALTLNGSICSSISLDRTSSTCVLSSASLVFDQRHKSAQNDVLKQEEITLASKI